MKIRATILLVLTLLSPLLSAQDKCIAQGQAEQARIQREFASNRPAQGDRDAEVAWARNLHAALAIAARRAEDCARASRQTTAPAAAAREQECAAKANQQLAELQNKYRGKSMSTQEQIARRGEEERLLDDRMACIRGASR